MFTNKDLKSHRTAFRNEIVGGNVPGGWPRDSSGSSACPSPAHGSRHRIRKSGPANVKALVTAKGTFINDVTQLGGRKYQPNMSVFSHKYKVKINMPIYVYE